jgi:hypothetical protein
MNRSTLKKVFQNCVVLLETHNEQKRHISAYFRQLNVNSVRYPMFTADYSFMVLPNEYSKNSKPLWFGDRFLIERKSGNTEKGGGFSELRGNLTSGHKLFKAEFQRMTNVSNVYLLIENAKDWNCINKVPTYDQKPGQFEKTLNSFLRNRNEERAKVGSKDVSLVYCGIEDAGLAVMTLIFNFLLEEFKDL